MSNLKNNTASLESLLEQANALPEEKTIQSSKTVTPTTSSQTVKPDSGYDGMGQVVVNAVPTATQATPSVSIDSAGKITATSTQSAGYVAAGTKTGTKQLTTQAAKTITPTKSSQTAVAKNVYTTGAVTVAAIPSQYITTTDASAAADDIVTGETAYVNGVKVTGTNPYEKAATDAEVEAQEALLAEIVELLRDKVIPSTLQTKTVTPSVNTQTITPDSGYNGLSQVTVNAMPTATQATPSISVDSAGKITASATQTAGYVAAGTKSATKQLTTQAAKTVTPSTSNQTAVASGVYTTGAVTVAAIPDSYVKPSSTKAATTYTPTTSNQTIAAGTYCSGVQTISGDANLVADNIKSGISIFGVTGTLSGGSSGGTLDTGSVALSKAMGGPGTYDYKLTFSNIPNFDTKCLIVLKFGTDAIIVLTRADTSSAFYLAGYIDVYESSDPSINVLSAYGYMVIYSSPYDASTATYYAI